MHLLQQMSRSGRLDARPDSDEVIWLRMPEVSAADFRLVDPLVALGYRSSREAVARIAEKWRLPREGTAPDTSDRRIAAPLLPPLVSADFVPRDGRSARFSGAARRLFGTPGSGPLRPGALEPQLRRLYLADLFASAWPAFRTGRDS